MVTRTVEWLKDQDLRWVVACNRAPPEWVVAVLRVASCAGDGPLWVVCAAVLAVVVGPEAGLRLVGALVACGVLYRLAKQVTARPRPHAASPDVRLLAAPLDRYSFPSGHTLHAVATAVVVTAHAPGAGWVVWPLAALIGSSRLVLGLHYPSDVLAGAVLGAAIGGCALAG
jgi:undecaprenyl-diphosphatase